MGAITFAALKGIQTSVFAQLNHKEKTAITVSDKDLADFLAQTRVIRLRLFNGYKEVPIEERRSSAIAIEKAALKLFESKADKGSRRHQFYLGRTYYELYWLTNENSYLDSARRLSVAAENQGHPDAVLQQIGKMPCKENAVRYIKAIRLGSVSALAHCSGAVHATFNKENWMKVGPILNHPEQAAVDHWSDVFINWMIIYHFLIRWDRKGQYLSLSLPNKDLLNIVCGLHPADDGYVEEFSVDFMRECTESAADHARNMDTDFYPEEIYDAAWNKLFRFRSHWE